MAGEALPAVHKNEELLLQLLFWLKKTTTGWWFKKSFAMPSPAAAESLPLTKEVDSP